MQDIGLANGIEDWFSKDVVKGMSDYVGQMHCMGDRTRNLLDVKMGCNGSEMALSQY